MPIDRQRLEFGAIAIQVAERAGGTLGITGSRQFADRLYEEWKVTRQQPKQAEAWLKQRLQGAFVSLAAPPNWVEDEGAWQYHADQPMVFITQADVGVNESGGEPLSPDAVVYLFGVREPAEGGGFRVIYKTVVQRRAFGVR